MLIQKPTKTVTTAYSTTDADNGYRIICNSASALAITLHSATGRYNFEIEIDNIGAGEVTVGGQTLKQYTHAHIGNNGGSAWSVVVGGGQLSQATESALGGVKAKAKTTETTEVAIDGATGKLYVPVVGAAENGIPEGGTTNQLLAKNSDTAYDGKWVDAPAAANGIPSGGTAGQMLIKASSSDFDAAWGKIITLKNILTNGNLDLGTTNWTGSRLDTTTKRSGKNSLKVTSTGGTVTPYHTVPSIISGHKYYGCGYFNRSTTLDGCSAQMDVLAGGLSGEMDFATISDTTLASTGIWYLLSNVVTAPSDGENSNFRTYLVGSATYYADDMMLIDLTASFGAGNEPSKAAMDAAISALPNGYVDGYAFAVI